MSADGALTSPSAASQHSVDTVVDSPNAARQANRHSMEATLAILAQKSAFGQGLGSGSSSSRPSLSSLQSSYSTNDIPTLKGSTEAPSATITSPTVNESSFHKHNASLGRIPPSAMNKRFSRDLSNLESRQGDAFNGIKQLQTDIQPSATSFGSPTTAGSPTESSLIASPGGLQQFNNQAYYGGYGIPVMNMGMSALQLGTASPYSNGMQYYQAQNQFGSYAPYNAGGRVQDSQSRIIQQRRMQNAEG